jgi:multidrug efflux pump subunit AcrA (membrane-fusion protein)
VRAEQREEERVQRELQKEQEEAEKDEAKYEKALEKARSELGAAIDAEREAMLARVQALEADLAAAHSRKERAMAQAQLTKMGHVYVISNIGAFGEGVLKIGLTRRLDPEERIKELGDASVPFPFDLHALIYSENAPALESELHNRFWERRLNWANDRKEFFTASLEEVNAVLKELRLEASVLGVPEAREYRETLVAIGKSRSAPGVDAAALPARGLPEDPFAPTTESAARPGNA